MLDTKNESIKNFQCPRGESCPLSEELVQLRNRINELEQFAQTDGLTGLFNKRYFDANLRQELERTQRTGMPTTLILLDVDHFKRFNDNYGHLAGDSVLQHLANILKANTRNLDIPCRYGGEEFAIILPSTPLLVGVQVAERLRALLAASTVTFDQHALDVTASFGIDSSTFEQHDSPTDFLQRVDNLLYAAKKAGRDCVKHAPPKPRSSHEVTPSERDALL